MPLLVVRCKTFPYEPPTFTQTSVHTPDCSTQTSVAMGLVRAHGLQHVSAFAACPHSPSSPCSTVSRAPAPCGPLYGDRRATGWCASNQGSWATVGVEICQGGLGLEWRLSFSCGWPMGQRWAASRQHFSLCHHATHFGDER